MRGHSGEQLAMFLHHFNFLRRDSFIMLLMPASLVRCSGVPFLRIDMLISAVNPAIPDSKRSHEHLFADFYLLLVDDKEEGTSTFFLAFRSSHL